MKKIAIAQYWTSNLSYGKYTQEINAKYCKEKGYDYYVDTDDNKILSSLAGKAVTWYKPLFILEVLDNYSPDYILFLDADAIVSDFSYKIEDFIDENYDIICTEDYGPSKINAGVFIFKNSEWTKKFLAEWWMGSSTIRGGSDNVPGYYSNALWHDQTCFGIILDRNQQYNSHVKIIPNNVLNGREYKNLRDKNFIFHAFAYGNIKNRTIDLAYYDIFNVSPYSSEKSLSELSKNYDTDKQYEHNYFDLVYSSVFDPIKEKVKTFVEIGILHGQSLILWRDFFQNSNVIGVDIDTSNAKKRLENIDKTRIDFVELDQSNEAQLDLFASQHSNIDVILDDGCHRMREQQIGLAKLFKCVKEGGIYIIEDLHTSLEALMPEKRIFNWGDPDKTITLLMLEEFQKTGKIKSDYLTDEEIDYLNNNIKEVKIYRNRPDWSITSIIYKKEAELSNIPVTADSILEEKFETNKNDKIYVVYHCYLVNNWKSLIIEQLDRLVKSGLYDAAEEVWVTVILNTEKEETFRELVKKYKKLKFNIEVNNSAEYLGIKKVKELGDSNKNAKIFYFHTKGVSNIHTNKTDNVFCPEKVVNIQAWRECLEYFLIDRWEESLEKLESNDCVGVTNINGWYWGNFWWANSEYIKKCAPVGHWGRWDYEAWLNNYVEGEKRFFQWYSFNYNPYLTHIEEEWYKEKEIILKKATYGTAPFSIDEGFGDYTPNVTVDITSKIDEELRKTNYKKFNFQVSNYSVEDPAPGKRKFIFIEYYLNTDKNKLRKLCLNEGFYIDFTP